MPSRKGLLHIIYKCTGHCLCRFFLVWCYFRDKFSSPTANAILFVAHPDDDTLFFHTFIKKYRPYVCLLTTGWSLRRIPCFIKTMRKYGVRFRFYDLDTRDTRYSLLCKYISACLALKNFEICVTHGETGEYGHVMHQRVYKAVASLTKCPLFTPVSEDAIGKYPLSTEVIQEKRRIFQENYATEKFVLDQYKIWVENEHLVCGTGNKHLV